MIHGLVYSHYFYMFILLFGIVGLTIADWQYKLVFFKNFSAAWKTIVILISFLLAADIVGIKLGIFFTNQKYITGLFFGTPNLPIEEMFFLFLLSYVTLVLYQVLNQLFIVRRDSDENYSRHSSGIASNNRDKETK